MTANLTNLADQKNDAIIIILCTTPNLISARAIAQHLLTSKLAACITLLPGVTSFYTWQGVLEEQSEVQLLIKSNRLLQDAVFQQIKAHHPYHTPELLVLPVISGDNDYLSWLKAN